ncbi:unnamed protein product, partial [Iphiclides podalirius]
MEAKLKEYRALRRRKEMIDNAKAKLEESKEKIINFLVPKSFTNMAQDQGEGVVLLEKEVVPIHSKVLIQPEERHDDNSEVCEALVKTKESWSTRPKKRGEVSAYSVFNENCTSIDGTLKAEQFEREIRYGPSSVR